VSYYSGKKKFETMTKGGFSYGMIPDKLKRIQELEKENKALREIVIQKELKGKLKDNLLKKKFALEKIKNS
jgi:putative transposase